MAEKDIKTCMSCRCNHVCHKAQEVVTVFSDSHFFVAAPVIKEQARIHRALAIVAAECVYYQEQP